VGPLARGLPGSAEGLRSREKGESGGKRGGRGRVASRALTPRAHPPMTEFAPTENGTFSERNTHKSE